MPEVHAKIPTLNLPTGHSSETETSNTDRSTDTPCSSASSHAAHNKLPRKVASPQVGGAANRKLRKPTGRRSLKKPQLKIGSHQKTAASVAHLKSNIPRLLPLTTSSSSTSVATTNSASLQLAQQLPKSVLHINLPPIAPLVREPTAFLKYTTRRSITQMDFKQSRRTGNFQMKPSVGNESDKANALVPANSGIHDKAAAPNMQGVLVSTNNCITQKIFNQDNYYYVFEDQRPKTATLRIFATIMLNAWRKRRDEVKRLMGEVNDLKRGVIKNKNQLHVFNTLFRHEQRRNEDLHNQLKQASEDIKTAKSSAESLEQAIAELKIEKEGLELQLEGKSNEFESINTIFIQTKADLFNSMAMQRELQSSLSMEQRKVQFLETQKKDLEHELFEMHNACLQKVEKLLDEAQYKDAELERINEEMRCLEDVIENLKDTDIKLREYAEVETKLNQEIEALQTEVKKLRHGLACTVGGRMRSCWRHFVGYNQLTLQLLHWLAFIMLPATPAPRLTAPPVGLSLEKAMSIVKR